MIHFKEISKRLLFIIMLTISPVVLFAQDTTEETEEERLERIVQVFFVGNNDYEFYKALENLRNYYKSVHDQYKYFKTMSREVCYDLNHNYYSKALEKTEQIKDELIKQKAEDYYYMVDDLLGTFYGSRDENELSRKYLMKAANAIKPGTNDNDLLNIYSTLANISILSEPEDGPNGYYWADKAIALAKTPRQRCSTTSLKGMVAIGHNDKKTFDDCYREVVKIREENPQEELSMYWKYMHLGRFLFDGDFDQAVKACDSITLDIPRLCFLSHIYKLKGDKDAEIETLYKLMAAKDKRNNEISTLTINDINQDIQMEQQRITGERIKLYTHIAITLIVALLILGLTYFLLNRSRRGFY